MKYLQPSVIEQWTILPFPVILLTERAAKLAVIPKEQEAKSARKLVGNYKILLVLFLLMMGRMPDVLI